MGTFQSFRKAYGALKDYTTVGLANFTGEFRDMEIAIVKATNHVESPPKERHVKKIFAATSVVRPRADVAYCIHALARRLAKTRNWIVATKVLVVIHRTLREGHPTFREELLNYSRRARILHISNFKDDSSPFARDCSKWVRAYALFLEERLECFRILKYDIETQRLTRPSPKVRDKMQFSSCDESLEQLQALQQLLCRLIGCQPKGTTSGNYLIKYALALVLKESFKIYCAINDGIINLVDMFFEMPKQDAIKALKIYKRASQQAEILADFYDFCKQLELARNFQFPSLKQPPPSFLATMEEYVKEAPRSDSTSNNKTLDDQGKNESLEKLEEVSPTNTDEHVEEGTEEKPLDNVQEESRPKSKPELPPLISTNEDDVLGMNEANPSATRYEESNALALAIIPQGKDSPKSVSSGLKEVCNTGWELALLTKPTNLTTNNIVDNKLAGGFDKLLLDSLYEDESRRRQQQHGMATMQIENSYCNQNGFIMTTNIAPPPTPTNMQTTIQWHQQQQQQQQQELMLLQHYQQSQQMTMIPNRQQQHQQHQQQMMVLQHHQYEHVTMIPYPPRYLQQAQSIASSNPFGDPFSLFHAQHSSAVNMLP